MSNRNGNIQFQCCGVNGSASFNALTPVWNNNYTIGSVSVNAEVPLSCCTIKDPSKFPTDLGSIEFEVGTDITQCLVQKRMTNTEVSRHNIGVFLTLNFMGSTFF